MPMQQPLQRIGFILLASIYLTLAGWYAVMTPPGEGVDEAHHFDYAAYVAREKQLPIYQAEAGTKNVIMIHHPPLYYIVGGALIMPFSQSDRSETLRFNPHFIWDETGSRGWRVILPVPGNASLSGTLGALYTLRAFSILLGLAAILFVHRTTQILFPASPWLALSATAITALNPSFIYMSSIVHHDVMLVLVMAAGIYRCVQAATAEPDQPMQARDSAMLGLLCGTAMLVKISGVALALPTAYVILLGNRHWRARARHLVIAGVTAFLIAGWWYLRNWVLYGDPTAHWLFVEQHAHMLRPTILSISEILSELRIQFGRTYWGAFGYMHILLPAYVSQTSWLLAGICAAGWLIVLSPSRRTKHSSATGSAPWIVLLLAFSAICTVIVGFSQATMGAGHARYLMPASITLSAIIAGGLGHYFGKHVSAGLPLLIVTLMTGHAVISPALYAWPRYALASAGERIEDHRASTVDITFERGVRLVAVASDRPFALPNHGLSITTYWQAYPSTNASDVYVDLTVSTDTGRTIGKVSFWPDPNSSPNAWGSQIISNTQAFYVPADQAAGRVIVSAQVRDGLYGLPLHIPAINTYAWDVRLLEIPSLGEAMRVDESALPQQTREEVFAETLQLAALPAPELDDTGSLLTVTTYWRTRATPAANYTLFMHLLDSSDRIVAQLDTVLGGEATSTSTWKPNELRRASYVIPLPDQLPEGRYRLRIGLYTWPDMNRAQIRNSAGAPLGDLVITDDFELAR